MAIYSRTCAHMLNHHIYTQVASRPAFEQHAAEQKAKQDRVRRSQEKQLLEARRLNEQQRHDEEAAKERAARHEERLRNLKMTIPEQQSAAQDLRGFGVPIRRPGSPETVLIGSRRLGRVKAPRLIKTSRGASFPAVADTKVMKSFIVQVMPAHESCRWMEANECFAGAFRLRIRYKDIAEVPKRDDDSRLGGEDGPRFTGAMRRKPIRLRIQGSDGYLGVWTEKPVDAAAAKWEHEVEYRFRGVLETDMVPEAERGIQDFLRICGVDGTEKANAVEDAFELEFLQQ